MRGTKRRSFHRSGRRTLPRRPGPTSAGQAQEQADAGGRGLVFRHDVRLIKSPSFPRRGAATLRLLFPIPTDSPARGFARILSMTESNSRHLGELVSAPVSGSRFSFRGLIGFGGDGGNDPDRCSNDSHDRSGTQQCTLPRADLRKRRWRQI